MTGSVAVWVAVGRGVRVALGVGERVGLGVGDADAEVDVGEKVSVAVGCFGTDVEVSTDEKPALIFEISGNKPSTCEQELNARQRRRMMSRVDLGIRLRFRYSLIFFTFRAGQCTGKRSTIILISVILNGTSWSEGSLF